jgi:ArsR family transcriptional regulator
MTHPDCDTPTNTRPLDSSARERSRSETSGSSSFKFNEKVPAPSLAGGVGWVVVYASKIMTPRRSSTAAPPPPADLSAVHVRSDPVYVVKAQLFRVLGHPVRIRMLELLSDGERAVGDLQAELNLDSSGTSQHLAALRQQGVLERRRSGTSVYYRIRDPRVTQLLAVAKQILTSALSDSHALLSDLADEPTPPSRRR